MPLERAEIDSDPIADPYGVDFWMQDADTKVRVLCKVSRGFLDDRADAIGDIGKGVLARFEVLRPEIEVIASRIYDEGDKNHVVVVG